MRTETKLLPSFCLRVDGKKLLRVLEGGSFDDKAAFWSGLLSNWKQVEPPLILRTRAFWIARD